ncbi:MAG: ABC transporter substrate-binding protein [Clostridium sp.]|nr:ABC transporter substrate-binding protein [Clostridium sp.]
MKSRKIIALMTSALLMLGVLAGCGSKDDGPETDAGAGTGDTEVSYEVTEPITIEWWHSLESQYQPTLDKVIEDFEAQNDNITVEAIYQGSYADLNEKLVAAQAAGTTLPAVTVANTPYVAEYGESGVGEILDPYIEATDFDINDFGEGLITSSSYDGKQIALPFQISTQVMYYNKDIVDAEGIELPKNWDDMDRFMEEGSVVSGGTTERYATVFPAWDHWYFEPYFINRGVNIVNEDGKTTDLDGDIAIDTAKAFQRWEEKGESYMAYGKEASTTMRENFFAGRTLSTHHTSSLYDMYVDNADFEVGMMWLPGDKTDMSEVGGNVLFIPAKNSQEVKNAGWQLLSYLTSVDVNMVWATETGYMPTRNSVTQTDEADKFLEEKPAFKVIFDNLDKIQPRIQHPSYTALADIWKEKLAEAVIEGKDVEAEMKEAAELINEVLEED